MFFEKNFDYLLGVDYSVQALCGCHCQGTEQPSKAITGNFAIGTAAIGSCIT